MHRCRFYRFFSVRFSFLSTIPSGGSSTTTKIIHLWRVRKQHNNIIYPFPSLPSRARQESTNKECVGRKSLAKRGYVWRRWCFREKGYVSTCPEHAYQSHYLSTHTEEESGNQRKRVLARPLATDPSGLNTTFRMDPSHCTLRKNIVAAACAQSATHALCFLIAEKLTT